MWQQSIGERESQRFFDFSLISGIKVFLPVSSSQLVTLVEVHTNRILKADISGIGTLIGITGFWAELLLKQFKQDLQWITNALSWEPARNINCQLLSRTMSHNRMLMCYGRNCLKDGNLRWILMISNFKNYLRIFTYFRFLEIWRLLARGSFAVGFWKSLSCSD